MRQLLFYVMEQKSHSKDNKETEFIANLKGIENKEARPQCVNGYLILLNISFDNIFLTYDIFLYGYGYLILVSWNYTN